MDKTQFVIALFGLFISNAVFTFTISKFALRGYFDELNARFNAHKESTNKDFERIESDHKECRSHCDNCRNICAIGRKEDLTRLYDKLDEKVDK